MLGGSRAHSDREIAAAAPGQLGAPGDDVCDEDRVAHRRAAILLPTGALMAHDDATVAQRSAAIVDDVAVAHRRAATIEEDAPGEAQAAKMKIHVAHRSAATNRRRYRGCRGRGQRQWRRRQSPVPQYKHTLRLP